MGACTFVHVSVLYGQGAPQPASCDSGSREAYSSRAYSRPVGPQWQSFGPFRRNDALWRQFQVFQTVARVIRSAMPDENRWYAGRRAQSRPIRRFLAVYEKTAPPHRNVCTQRLHAEAHGLYVGLYQVGKRQLMNIWPVRRVRKRWSKEVFFVVLACGRGTTSGMVPFLPQQTRGIAVLDRKRSVLSGERTHVRQQRARLILQQAPQAFPLATSARNACAPRTEANIATSPQ